MKIIDPSYEILLPNPIDGIQILKDIEKAGRTCYKSEDKITEDSCVKFVKMLVERGHHAMIEHGPSISVKFICNRGFTHELVRSRLCSYAQESTRYVRYGDKKEFVVIKPPTWESWSQPSKDAWETHMGNCENTYLFLLEQGLKPQEARGVLPIDVKTEIVIKANIREWRHIFTIRTAKAAHPSMHQLMRPLCVELKDKIPVLFNDIAWLDTGIGK